MTLGRRNEPNPVSCDIDLRLRYPAPCLNKQGYRDKPELLENGLDADLDNSDTSFFSDPG